jgi:Uma2 family endonuclease
MIATIEKRNHTVQKNYLYEDYLRKEDKSVYKSEFFNGQIIKMPGAKYRHNVVASNVITAFNNAIQSLEKEYIVLNSDQKIFIESENTSVYPDALVLCEAPIFWNNREDIIINPLLIVEVLSKSTHVFDRSTKFWWYKSLPSFRQYILIDPNKALVEVWFRSAENTWQIHSTTDLQSYIEIQAIENISLSVADFYKKLTF